MFLRGLAAAVLLAQNAAAQNANVGKLLRFACSHLVIERTDPIVQPGAVPSSHTHQIVGGNSFNATVSLLRLRRVPSRGSGSLLMACQMDPANMDPAAASTCTTCTYSEDFSNYWTASLYFRSPENGSYKMVPQMPGFRGLDGIMHPQGGGISVYYMTPYGGAGNGKVTAFKPVRQHPPLVFSTSGR